MIKLLDNTRAYSKTCGRLWQYCRVEPNDSIGDFESFKFKSKFWDNTNNAGITDAKIAVLLK